MSRTSRAVVGGMVYHTYNRGNGRLRIFTRSCEFEQFVSLLAEGREHADVRLLGYCLMPTHWHLVLLPRGDRDLSRYVGWVSNAHVRRWHRERQSAGGGHIYKGRYHSFPIERGEPLLRAIRYIEANSVRAGLVASADGWEWSSLLARRKSNAGRIPSSLPLDVQGEWVKLVNQPLEESELAELRMCVRRGRPYGTSPWVAETVLELGLQHTLRNPWRPKRS